MQLVNFGVILGRLMSKFYLAFAFIFCLNRQMFVNYIDLIPLCIISPY